jgi:hypothetical protein
MRHLLAAFWQRRWCRSLLLIAIAFGLACLSPFIRQTLFGPRFGDVPWCVWEQQLRVHAGDDRSPPAGLDWSRRDLVPLYWHLAEDDDPRVRRIALLRLMTVPHLDPLWPSAPQKLLASKDPTTISILQRHLYDDSAQCRLVAACGLWAAFKDREAKTMLLSVANDRDVALPRDVIGMLSEIPDIPELFDRLAQSSADPDWATRHHAVRSMRHFGKRGLPIIQKTLEGKELSARREAAKVLSLLGKDAAELMPLLLSLLDDRDERIRQHAHMALTAIEPLKFPAPAKARD